MNKVSKYKMNISLRNGLVDIVYPKHNSKESAIILANTLLGNLGIVEFVNDKNQIIYGVLFNTEEMYLKKLENDINDNL